jgi:hypothetical protein
MILEASMALVLGLAVGDVVDIADYWIAVISVDSRRTATLITKDGQKIPVSSKHETEIAPTVWVQLGPWTGKRHLKLLFTAPRSVSIMRRHGETT